MKLQGRRDYRESVNRKKQEQTVELSFGLQMFEEASCCAADTAGGGRGVSGSSSGMSCDFEPSEL